MKANTTDAKRLIQQAISSMPADFTLSEARYHLKAALGHVEHVEKKRVARDVTQKQNEVNARFSQMGQVQGVDLKESLKTIDDLIAKEQKKLDEIAAKRQSRAAPKDVDDSEEDLMRD